MSVVPIRLKYATLQSFGISGMTWSYLYTRVKVKNIAYQKSVQLCYRSGAVWHAIPLAWRANYGDYDIYGLDNGPYTEEFALSYEVDGQSYWDNNNGANYRLSAPMGLVGGNVVLSKISLAVPPAIEVALEIYVSNISYGKRVGIRQSIDNWKSWSDMEAYFQSMAQEGSYSGAGGVEVWRLVLPLYPFPYSMQFAVYYQDLDHGPWYWDDNFGQNYRLTTALGGLTVME